MCHRFMGFFLFVVVVVGNYYFLVRVPVCQFVTQPNVTIIALISKVFKNDSWILVEFVIFAVLMRNFLTMKMHRLFFGVCYQN